jgi:hypothetical protein
MGSIPTTPSKIKIMDKTKRLLWLDDCRNPFDIETDWLIFSPIGRNIEVKWVVNYQEFVDWIIANGLPDAICFDHDLADEHYRMSMYDTDGHYNNYYTDGTFKEKTGFDCAKWLVNYCMDRKLELPLYNIQSANPIGRENIKGLLENYNKHLKL